jgi:hypothetical protein
MIYVAAIAASLAIAAAAAAAKHDVDRLAAHESTRR